jgi:hypothetical protein
MASMMQLPPDVPDDVVWAAAQLAVAHHLNPFNGEIMIMDMGAVEVDGQWIRQYRPHVGIKGLRVMARRQANYMTRFDVMSPDEVQQQRRGDYDPDDIGVRCTLWRLDVARECQQIGIPYQPVVAMGFYRRRAKWSKKKTEWMADNIPNTWTAQQVAEKRAEANAIKQAFDMQIEIADPATEDEYIEAVARMVEVEDQRTAPMLERSVGTDEEGLYAVENRPASTNVNGKGAQYAAAK